MEVRRPGVLRGHLAALRIQDVRQIRAVHPVLLRRRALQIRPFLCAWDVWGVGHQHKNPERLVRQGNAVPEPEGLPACDRRSVFRAAIRSLSREQMAQRWMLYKPAAAPFAASPCAVELAR